MATLVSFHAHPDDEAIACGGTMAKASAAGHRVVVVFATRGERGEVDAGVLEPGEELGHRREREVEAAARILGVHRTAFLDYVDSGMHGTPGNDDPASFWQADVEEAAGRLAAILRDERVDVLTIYDDHGVYGHPDHVQVHRVGKRAAELAGVGRVYESTLNRDYLLKLVAMMPEQAPDEETPTAIELDQMGVPEELITTVVDVRDHLDQKRRAMAAHASQISETSFFLSMPPDVFTMVWGQEWFVRVGAAPGTRETDLFDGLA